MTVNPLQELNHPYMKYRNMDNISSEEIEVLRQMFALDDISWCDGEIVCEDVCSDWVKE